MNNQAQPGPLGDFQSKLTEAVREGLEHGFFELHLTCEIVKDRKRQVLVHSGRMFKFIIPESDCA
jgi:hypothetical protein